MVGLSDPSLQTKEVSISSSSKTLFFSLFFWKEILSVLLSLYFYFLQCLLNESEIEIKTKLWMEENKEYLQKQKGENNVCSYCYLYVRILYPIQIIL